jgi:enoyl-CoA hydratase
MTDLHIRIEQRAGRITLTRPGTLNALSWEMCLAVERALDAWRDDPEVALLVIDADGERAFCAGGDLLDIYEHGRAGDHEHARRFWRDEYRMNAKLFRFPKPVVTFLHGFTMGGGVGLGCHASHRIVRDDSRIAMPECGIGLVPDVGGTLLLARAPGRLGERLALTAHRMGPGDAIHAGFADYRVPEGWDALKAELAETGDWEAVDRAASPAPESPLAAEAAFTEHHFGGQSLADVVSSLRAEGARATLDAIAKVSPLSAACALQLVRRARGFDAIEPALGQEFRFTARATEHGDFLEGIRAQIVDRDRAPRWRHPSAEAVATMEVSRMLMPLPEPLSLETPA